MGIQQSTLSRWVNDKVARFDKHIIEALIGYFDCGLNDLFELHRDENPQK